MKQKILLLAVLVCNLTANIATAAETEPNNTRASANTLALNGSNTGAVDPGGDQDWWQVTTNADGKLNVTLQGLGGRYMSLRIYDNNGITEFTYQDYISPSATLSVDGLAVGTYYIKVSCTSPTDTSSYNISNTLTLTGITNDAEPDSTKAQALILPLNGSKKGHIGYYYNNHRDSVDWYKVTTNADGELDISITVNTGAHYISLKLYDNDGITLLNYQDYIHPAATIKTDGLAAGTYYIKLYCTGTNDFDTYTLSDTLIKPTIITDVEPNGTANQALTLAQNGSAQGHVGYYYNNRRDTADWYKLTTTNDGELDITLSYNYGNHFISMHLYDANKTTVINYQDYISPSATIKTDGLAAGTYYIKVNCTGANDFDTYTLKDTLKYYHYGADFEPDGRPYQAYTMPANLTVAGHVGFYYNGVRDTFDFWKINYTGSGPLTLTLNADPHNVDGSFKYMSMHVFKDTNASEIYYADYINPGNGTFTANLTSLTAGYYYVKIYCTGYASDFAAYGLGNSFGQLLNIAKIKATSYDTAASCSSINTVTFTCSNGSAPYKVILYRYGINYSQIITKTNKATFINLSPGIFYAKAYSDGATGSAFSKSKNVGIVPIPGNPFTTNVTATQAKLNWTPVSCSNFDSLYVRIHGTNSWYLYRVPGTSTSVTLSSLMPSTIYDWKIAAGVSQNGVTGIGAFTNIVVFTTAASFAASKTEQPNALKITANDGLQLVTIPNPASNSFKIQFSSTLNSTVTATLLDMNGKTVWFSGRVLISSLNGKLVNADQFQNGIYYLKITNEQGQLMGTGKVVIAK
jgi:hypothetical protein